MTDPNHFVYKRTSTEHNARIRSLYQVVVISFLVLQGAANSSTTAVLVNVFLFSHFYFPASGQAW